MPEVEWDVRVGPPPEMTTSDEQLVLVELATGTEIGGVFLRYDGSDCWLDNIRVDAFTGGSASAHLLDATIEHAQQRGCRRIRLDAYELAETVRDVAKRRGFGPAPELAREWRLAL
jgi:GNAT superfamily N-acetyltransferase